MESSAESQQVMVELKEERSPELPLRTPAVSVILQRTLNHLLSSDELRILASIARTPRTVDEMNHVLGGDVPDRVRERVGRLYLTGFISRSTTDTKTRYMMRPLPEIVKTQLKEGRLDHLDAGQREKLRQYYNRYYVMTIASRMKKGRLEHSSEVIPVQKTLPVQRQVLDHDMRRRVLEQAEKIALTECTCRKLSGQCEGPLDTCILLDEVAQYHLSRGQARPLTISDALDVMNMGNGKGLVTMTLFSTQQKANAICSCCACCCHEFQALLRFGMRGCIKPSGYLASVDHDLCIGCGVCIESCPFGCMILRSGLAHAPADLCYGCGLCASVCPSEAIRMRERPSHH